MADIAEAIKRARESRQGYLGSRFGAPAESDSESIYIATTRNAWKAAVDVIEAGLELCNESPIFYKKMRTALTAFAEAMGEKQ